MASERNPVQIAIRHSWRNSGSLKLERKHFLEKSAGIKPTRSCTTAACLNNHRATGKLVDCIFKKYILYHSMI
jgi:hypothetical protein